MKQTARLKTRDQVRAEFAHKGLSLAAWARDHAVSTSLVYEILGNGSRRRCLRGQSHRVAVLLGLKHGELPAANTTPTQRVA